MSAAAEHQPAPAGAADLAEVAYRAFRELILDGSYPPGTPFPITNLADSMGWSRTPARAAALRLQQEGLLTKSSGRPPVVAEMADARIESWYALRIMIEGVGVMTTVPRLRPRHLAHLHELMDDMREAARREDLDLWERPHREFHRVLISASGEAVREVAESISERTEWARRVRLLRVPQWQRAVHEHEQMLRRSEAGEARETAVLLVAHYNRTVTAILGRDVSAEGEIASVVGMLGLDPSAHPDAEEAPQ